MLHSQIIDIIDMGIIIIDRHYMVQEWNRWMELHSNIKRDDILYGQLFNFYPNLSNPSFLRGCKSVLTFGQLVFLSQKLHGLLFPFKLSGTRAQEFEHMQQSCTMAPLTRGGKEIDFIVITVQDVTDHVILEKRLRSLNLMDSLTSVYNRRHLDERLKEEYSRHQRYNREMSVMMIDMDNFKSVNDTYGHQVGDQVLREVAEICKRIIRDADILSRYGGEEFCCILPETDRVGAISVAERLRMEIEKQTMTAGDESFTMTACIGISELSKGISSPDELLKIADDAMYAAKRAGKNRVVAINPDTYITDLPEIT